MTKPKNKKSLVLHSKYSKIQPQFTINSKGSKNAELSMDFIVNEIDNTLNSFSNCQSFNRLHCWRQWALAMMSMTAMWY